MIARVLAEANHASWVEVLAFVRRFPNDVVWNEWKRDMLALLEAAVADGLDPYFRAGQSMQHVIFSIAEKHGLEYLEPHPSAAEPAGSRPLREHDSAPTLK